MQPLPLHSSQRGAALITALLILMVLTVIGISALRTSSTQETIVGNLRDQDLAFQAADTALTAAETNIDAIINPPLATNSGANNGIYTRDLGNASPVDWKSTVHDKTNTWNTATGIATEFGTTAQELTELSADPLFVIEEEGFLEDDLGTETQAQGLGKYSYRITARGQGKAGSTVSLLQETFAKRYK